MRCLVPLTTLVACVALPRGLAAQETAPAFEARVWLDRGAEPVLRRGEDVRVFYRTNEDAFAAIFRIDTDGRVHLIYPQHPDAIDVVRADRDYRLLFPQAPVWRVSEDPGVGYLFIVASPEPLDFSSFPYDEYHGWDVSAVGDVVYTDPYVAIDDYVARIIPNWEQVPYALDFVTYSVGETHSYPRFLCYDCHTYQAYSSWNPYDYTCSTFRVVIWDDPYFYPRYRYSGVNVVVVQRPVRAALPRYEVTRRVVGDAVRPIVRTRTAVEYKEPATARGIGRVAATPTATRTTSAATRTTPAATRTSTVAPRATATSRAAAALASSPTRAQAVPQERPQERPRTGPQEAPDTTRSRPTLQRRPSSRLPVRTPPSRDPQQPAAPPSSAAPSRLPARTPSARPDASPSRPSNPPGASARPTAPSSRQPSSSRAVPSTGRDTQRPDATPSRPPARVTPAPSSGRPSTGSSRPQAAPSRPQAAPSRSSGSSGGGSRPSASPAPARGSAQPRSSEPRSEPRSSEPRPSVRSRPTNPPR